MRNYHSYDEPDDSVVRRRRTDEPREVPGWLVWLILTACGLAVAVLFMALVVWG